MESHREEELSEEIYVYVTVACHAGVIRAELLASRGCVCEPCSLFFVCVFLFRFKALLSSKPTNDSTCIEIGYVKYPIFQVSPCSGPKHRCGEHRSRVVPFGHGPAN